MLSTAPVPKRSNHAELLIFGKSFCRPWVLFQKRHVPRSTILQAANRYYHHAVLVYLPCRGICKAYSTLNRYGRPQYLPGSCPCPSTSTCPNPCPSQPPAHLSIFLNPCISQRLSICQSYQLQLNFWIAQYPDISIEFDSSIYLGPLYLIRRNHLQLSPAQVLRLCTFFHTWSCKKRFTDRSQSTFQCRFTTCHTITAEFWSLLLKSKSNRKKSKKRQKKLIKTFPNVAMLAAL